VEAAAVGAGEDEPAPDGWGRVDVVAGAVRPAELPALRAEGIDLAVGRADVDAVVRDRRRGVELAVVAEPRLRRRAPDQLPRARVEAVNVPVVGAEVDAAAVECDGALDRAARGERPDDLAVARGERVHLAAPVADVDELVRDER